MFGSSPTGSDHQDERMEGHQRAIGRLCGEWADLEIAVAEFFIFASGMPQDNFSKGICSAISFRDLIAASKVAAAVRFHCDPWIGSAKSELDYIDNQLRNERNRLVHDTWSIWQGQPTSFHVAPRLYKPQARDHFHLQVASIAQHTVEQIDGVSGEIRAVICHLAALQALAALPHDEQATVLATPRQRLLPRPQSETPDRGGINVRVR